MTTENGADIELERSLEALNTINQDINLIVEQLIDEEAALHAKYELKKAPLYKKRQGVIAKIPKFWLTCLEKHPIITSLIEMEDAEAISYLEDIEIERSIETPINYKVMFVFGENPYFSNNKLIKEFDLSDKGNAKVTNHKIDWKSGKDLTATAKKEEAENDSDDFSENEESSFFCWFDDENGSELADLIANDLFPNAGMYYTGAVGSDDEDELISFGLDSGVENADLDSGPENFDDSDDEVVEDAPATKRPKRE
ncbi:hypothetical protein LPJ77_001903 [Coemansia sp. RSA 2523]|nr:hypothetical protein LPJ54_001847 [Coemansia sp. RSA 1824]KAJ1790160.1 hypothetical protein LPJ62_002074 [Coemansia sp. RSA 2167]KAJ1809091.1 hypothetical protein LPJ77_001903 [Coemansia sp. RSA 2523]KAJ2130834.1 hypothetical protein GGF48_001839 [Coemansia sp. RSA 921]KAJ2137471.1 hypothetical protein GGH17_001548 [Coemansia sp. RSA 788]KAJ2145005.1 hypothetical protein IW142_002820 [Coemansia sp. RSA 564]KAJ2183754.1 hypothetical protein EV181_004726 [Coemansia sp. RSA 532]KAJ2201563.1 